MLKIRKYLVFIVKISFVCVLYLTFKIHCAIMHVNDYGFTGKSLV